jgi:hypothetical protein
MRLPVPGRLLGSEKALKYKYSKLINAQDDGKAIEHYPNTVFFFDTEFPPALLGHHGAQLCSVPEMNYDLAGEVTA